MKIFEAITLPSGLRLDNRIIKAAMEENMADPNQYPDNAIVNLYNAWAHGGVGAIITGNVMVDPLAMTGPGGISLHSSSDITPFITWADTTKHTPCKIIMQLNHPGRQTYKNLHGKTLSASDVAIDIGKHSSLFRQPTPMTENDIENLIERFATSAKLAESAGFDGVQIHAAHGYLLSQFLSPKVNKRTDKWGGSLENRARLLLSIVARVKSQVNSTFSVSVKLNSADFQKGGFDFSDAKYVISELEKTAIDFVELSGGSYESPAMQGRTADQSTLAREAYFLEFAREIAQNTNLIIMTTGGVKRKEVAENILAEKVSLVGIATALAFQPDLVNIWKTAPDFVGYCPSIRWKNKTLASLAQMSIIRRQLRRLGQLKHPKLNCSPLFSLITEQFRLARLTKRYRKNIASQL